MAGTKGAVGKNSVSGVFFLWVGVWGSHSISAMGISNGAVSDQLLPGGAPHDLPIPKGCSWTTVSGRKNPFWKW